MITKTKKPKPATPLADVPGISAELRALQRQRAVFIKSRIMVANRLQAIVAGTIGYHSGMEEKERTKKFAEASALIKAIAVGEVSSDLRGLVLTHQVGIDEFERMQAELEKAMAEGAYQFIPGPVASRFAARRRVRKGVWPFAYWGYEVAQFTKLPEGIWHMSDWESEKGQKP